VAGRAHNFLRRIRSASTLYHIRATFDLSCTLSPASPFGQCLVLRSRRIFVKLRNLILSLDTVLSIST
jgi:hypothetical protein